MTKTKKVGSAGRYGARYGLSVRKKISDMETGVKGRQDCPYCLKKAVKRIAAGIYECGKCKSKFAGKAYRV